MEACVSMKIIIQALQRISINYSSPNYSLRSQYYGRFRTLVGQCLSSLLGAPELCNGEEYSHLKSTLIRLKFVMDAKLQLTAEEEQEKDRMLFKMFLDNEKIEQKTTELRKEREEGEEKFDTVLKSKLEIIEGHRAFIEEANERNRSYLNSEIFRSEKNIETICKRNGEEKANIQESLKNAEQRLREVLKDNLEKEQVIRKEKQIAQLQLKKLLDKYDQEVGSRTSTGRELQAIYENEMTFLRKLEETCGAQEIQYDTLMHQKETEEKQWQEERMLLFMMNRAARIIQRNWRMVMAKKRLKKGKRGKGKGKKT